MSGEKTGKSQGIWRWMIGGSPVLAYNMPTAVNPQHAEKLHKAMHMQPRSP